MFTESFANRTIKGSLGSLSSQSSLSSLSSLSSSSSSSSSSPSSPSSPSSTSFGDLFLSCSSLLVSVITLASPNWPILKSSKKICAASSPFSFVNVGVAPCSSVTAAIAANRVEKRTKATPVNLVKSFPINMCISSTLPCRENNC